MNYFVTIGIEIHCELKTNTKMFSGAPVRFGEIANTCTSVVDLGHPGCLPCVNKEAVALAIKACTAMHCDLETLVRFDTISINGVPARLKSIYVPVSLWNCFAVSSSI